MHNVLLGTGAFAYLNNTGADLLDEVRHVARNAGLHSTNVLPISASRKLWFTWTGTNIQATLLLLAAYVGIEATDREIAIEAAVSADELKDALSKGLQDLPSATALAKSCPFKERRKYDRFLSDDLLAHSFALDVVDLDGVQKLIHQLLAQ